jgi:hypothetical protein
MTAPISEAVTWNTRKPKFMDVYTYLRLGNMYKYLYIYREIDR